MSTDFRSTPIAEALHVEEWGDGTPVVLVHGSLATAQEEWEAQRPLVDEGFHFLAPDRRGYGRSPAAVGEDFLQDGQDIAELMGDGAHLVGHSYGGVGALVAASLRPEATLSLTLLEPGTFALGQDHPAGRAFGEGARAVWDDEDADDLDWVVAFLKAVGSNPDEFPPEFLKAALPLVPVVRPPDRCGPLISPSRPWPGPPSRSSSCPVGTAPASMRSATTSPFGSAPRGRSPRERGTRCSSRRRQ